MKTLRVQSCVASFVIAILLPFQVSPAMADCPADEGGQGQAKVTFTKWLTAFTSDTSADMEGVVSGDVGGGLFAGEAIFLFSPDPNISLIEADYHINGGTHCFSAHNLVTQDNTTGTAVIKGVVTDGWLKGAKVDGQYQVIAPCTTVAVALFDLCFQGTLHVHGGGDSGH